VTPAADDVTSLDAIGSAAAGHHGPAPFTTTHWSVVLTAQGRSPAADQALEKLCRTYWPPIYSFIRREGRSVEDAQDLTQAFFARLLQRRDFDAVRQEKGRLRSYLLGSLKHFLVNERQRAMSVKRGEGRALIPLNELIARERSDPEPADVLTADRIYERRWALTGFGPCTWPARRRISRGW
jgi:DNA-directed RNA polymerase specialized sigma24 family protein